MINFVNFLLNGVYQAIEITEDVVNEAFDKTVKDVNYHFPNLTALDVQNKITSNGNELAVFLFRLGQLVDSDKSKNQLHWLLKQYCSCEIYFNNKIDEGFYVVHGQGTVIGSRNVIGKGFIIHQGCTIGHKKNGSGKGNIIGNNVTLYANSSIIGELSIGDNVVIGAHVLVHKNLPDNSVLTITNKTS